MDHLDLTQNWDETFLKFWTIWFYDVIMAFCCCLVFNVALSRLQVLCNFLQSDTHRSSNHWSYGIANQRFWFISSIQNGRRKNEKKKLRKSKNKTLIGVRWFVTADDEYGHDYVIRYSYMIDSENNGYNGRNFRKF